MIRSKFNFFSVYLMILLILGLFSLGIWLFAHPGIRLHNKFGGTNGPVIPGTILTLGALIILYFFSRYLTVIIIGNDRISLRNIFFHRVLERDELQSIDLLGRKRFFGNSKPAEALMIGTKDGKEVSLPDSLYRNMPELKRSIHDWYSAVLVEISPTRNQRAIIPSSDEKLTDIGSMDKFSGNYLTSMNGIFFYVTLIVFIWLALAPPTIHLSRSGGFAVALVPILSFYALFGFQLFYFRVSDEFLVISNHLFFWYKKIYRLEGIRELVLESPYKRSDSLRIRTNDFSSKAYGAGSLRKKDWRTLRKRLEDLGIPVRNEMYLDT